jgi:hypothetical protein
VLGVAGAEADEVVVVVVYLAKDGAGRLGEEGCAEEEGVYPPAEFAQSLQKM